jgi:hypothetical protein
MQMEPATIISIIALGVSALSALFSIYFWRDAHRPLVTARIVVAMSGNVAGALVLLVENNGNRPAKNIKLSVREEDLIAMLAPEQHCIIPQEIRDVFDGRTLIPVLKSEGNVSNAFGLISTSWNSTWIPAFKFDLPISISYQDFRSRNFSHNINLRIAYDDAFAGASWSSPP